jgi:hypothetical protein
MGNNYLKINATDFLLINGSGDRLIISVTATELLGKTKVKLLRSKTQVEMD